MRVRRLRQTVVTGVAVVAILSLAGCMSFDGEMALYKSGQWEGSFDLIADQEALALAGGEAGLDASVEDQLGPAGMKNEEEGVTYSWKKIRSGSSIVYRIVMSGSDLESLNAAMQGGASAQLVTGPDGKESIHFQFSPASLGTFDEAKFTLTAGKILDSDADRVAGGTAEWDDLSGYQTAQATVTGASQSSVATVLLVTLGGLGLLAAVGAAILVGRQMRRSTVPSSPRFCTSCGAELPPGAGFCMKCGTPQGR